MRGVSWQALPELVWSEVFRRLCAMPDERHVALRLLNKRLHALAQPTRVAHLRAYSPSNRCKVEFTNASAYNWVCKLHDGNPWLGGPWLNGRSFSLKRATTTAETWRTRPLHTEPWDITLSVFPDNGTQWYWYLARHLHDSAFRFRLRIFTRNVHSVQLQLRSRQMRPVFKLHSDAPLRYKLQALSYFVF